MSKPPHLDLLDDRATFLPVRRVAAMRDELHELPSRPTWAMVEAARRMLAKGAPVLFRRASVVEDGGRVCDAAIARARSQDEMREFERLASRIAEARGGMGPPVVVPALALAHPFDVERPVAAWNDAAGFVALMRRHWWPGWDVRRALSGEEPGEGECGWSIRLRAADGTHDIALIASPPVPSELD